MINLITKVCSCRQTKNKQETEIAIWILRIQKESFIDHVGFCDVLVCSLNTNEVRKVAAMANFNLNKNQRLNDALRAVYMGKDRGNFVAPWRRGPKPTLTMFSPHIRTLKTAYTLLFRNYMGLAQ